jgi:plastocyanin
MKKRGVLVVSVVICVIVTTVLLYMSQPPFSQVNPNSAVVIIQPGASVNASLGFEPTMITVVIGVNNTVIWKNEDSDWHDVHSETGLFYSGIIQPGASWTYTFTSPGIYPYVCDPHPWMTGTIIVDSISPSTS